MALTDDYIVEPRPRDPGELETQAVDTIRSHFPNYAAAEGNLDLWLIRALAFIAAQLEESTTDVRPSIFRWFGANLADLPPVDATPTSGTTAWTMFDDAGYTVPGGTAIALTSPDGGQYAFQTVDDFTVPTGQTVATGVYVEAVEPGAASNGISGTADLIDPLDYVLAITTEGTLTGGQDAEGDDEYLTRLRAELRLMAPRPILPEDFAAMAMRQPEVARSLALRGRILGGNLDTSVERAVTVAIVNSAGLVVTDDTRNAVIADLEARREVNFIVDVVNPTYTTINVTYSVTPWAGWDTADVKAQCDAALGAYLNPANWGQPTFGDSVGWVNESLVRWGEVNAVLNSVESVRYVDSLTLNGSGTGVNVSLNGVVSMPTLGTVSGFVNPAA